MNKNTGAVHPWIAPVVRTVRMSRCLALTFYGLFDRGVFRLIHAAVTVLIS